MAQNGWKEESLKGFVQSVKQRCYSPPSNDEAEKGDMIYSFTGNSDYVFDKDGKYIEIVRYESNNISTKATYTYNEAKNEVEKVEKNNNNAVQTKLIIKYNRNGEAVEEQLYNSMGDLIERLSHEYSNRKTIRLSTFCYTPKGELRWKQDYEYNNQGVNVGYEHYNANGKLSWYTTYKSDGLNNKIEELSYDEESILLSHYIYEYEYDEYDNWIKQLVYSYIDGEKILETIIEREISYY